VALFSGSFNPPHGDHLRVAEVALFHGMDAVIFCPHSLNLEKRAELAPVEHRLQMLRQLLQTSAAASRFYILDPSFIESFRELSTFSQIRENLSPEIGISILVGNDSIPDDYPVFLRDLDHLVHERDRHNSRYRKILRRSYVVLPVVETVSSTEIRARYKKGSGAHSDPAIHAYIVEQGLFR